MKPPFLPLPKQQRRVKPADHDNINILRNLERNEMAMDLVSRQGRGSFNVVTFSSIAGSLSLSLVNTAFSVLQEEQPLLRSTIHYRGNKAVFRLGRPVIEIVEKSLPAKGGVSAVLEESLNSQLDSSLSLIRVIYIPAGHRNSKHFLITITHHAICDGISCLELHARILTICDKLNTGQQIDQMQRRIPLPHRKMLPTYLYGAKGLAQQTTFALRSLCLPIFKPPFKIPSERHAPLEERRCICVHKVLEVQDTCQVVKYAREHSISVQALVAAALSLAAVYSSDNHALRSHSKYIYCRTYVDLRRRVDPPIPPDHLGFLASSITTIHRVAAKNSIIHLAQDINKKIASSLKKREYLPGFTLFTPSVVRHFIKRPDEYPMTVDISNTGIFDGDRKLASMTWCDAFFIPSNVIFGRVLTCAICTFAGHMTINFIASSPSISNETIELIAERMLATLLDAAKQ